VKALRFELGKVETVAIRERMLHHLMHIDKTLAKRVGEGLGLAVPAKIDGPLNLSIPADGDPKKFQPKKPIDMGTSAALSMAGTPKGDIRTRKVAVLAANGFDSGELAAMQKALTAAGAVVKIVAPTMGVLSGTKGDEAAVDFAFFNTASVLFDAVYVVGGEESVEALTKEAKAIHFVNEAFLHCKAIAATGAGVDLISASQIGALGLVDVKAEGKEVQDVDGVILSRGGATSRAAAAFVAAIGEHRFWVREDRPGVPA
jgi:catalase